MPLLDHAEIVKNVAAAIGSLLEENSPLDFSFTHERTITHRLAVGLESHRARTDRNKVGLWLA